MDYALAHFNMIEQQIRPWDVLDMRILDVMAATPRHAFVPDGFESLAYSETPIPLNEQSVTLEPKIIARFLQAANPQANENALEIGTGSGYQTALLSQLCRHVDSIELDSKLMNASQQRLTQLGYHNIDCQHSNAYEWNTNKMYDVIIINASVSTKPSLWLNQLSIGGRCIAVVGKNSAMQAICYTRAEQNQWLEETLFETEIPSLIGPQPSPTFTF